jgi:hypothetical protein
MQIWQDLIKYSLIGSERQTAPLTAETDLQLYINQLYPDNTVPSCVAREQALLSAAALVSQYRIAGVKPTMFDGVLPTADDAQALPLLAPLAVSHLQRLLNDNELKAIVSEWFTLAATVKRRVPFALIPPLLELAAQNRSLRPAITALIDKRGAWLANQHPDWHKLLIQADDEVLQAVSLWEEGNLAQREEYLRQYRQQDAAKARELLQAVWKQEPAATRQSFLAVLANQLSSDDEAFLNTCLEDRGKGVRQLAATLLGALPDSAFSQRQKQRLNSWLRYEKGGLLKKAKLIVELPETWDKNWQADGIEQKPPQGKGEKAWWLEQALSTVPPAYWSTQWQLSPADILALLNKHDWRDTLITTWKQALQNYPDSDWAEAFLTRFNFLEAELWLVITPAQAERLARQFFSSAEPNGLAKVLPILSYLKHAWSVDFSRQVINELQRYTEQKMVASDVYASYYLADIAAYLAPECCDLFASRLQKDHEYHQIT